MMRLFTRGAFKPKQRPIFACDRTQIRKSTKFTTEKAAKLLLQILISDP
jgi:hypothetical protein